MALPSPSSPEMNSPNVSRHIGCWSDCVRFISFVIAVVIVGSGSGSALALTVADVATAGDDDDGLLLFETDAAFLLPRFLFLLLVRPQLFLLFLPIAITTIKDMLLLLAFVTQQ